jgi:hypothetical protein
MRVLNVIAAPLSDSRARTIIKSGFSICWLVLVSLCIWVLHKCSPGQETELGPTATYEPAWPLC